jgi:hypothetical protein
MFKKPEFAYDDNSYYVGFSFSVIWQMDKNYDIKFLLGLLNSNFGKYWFTVNGKKRGIGVDIGVEKFREFPVPITDEKKQQNVINLVNTISDLTIQKKATIKQENELNKLIYKLYNLTNEEIELINKV